MPLMVCVVPVCPVRAEGSHKSEQVSQLLFGEQCEMLEKAKDFVRVRVSYDGYEGWCQSSQIEELIITEPQTEILLASSWVNQILIKGQPMQIPFGSTVSVITSVKSLFNYTGSSVNPAKNIVSEEIIRNLSATFLNTPYLWGGRSVFGVDCSGFTQIIFKFLNISLLRDAYQQAGQGEAVGFLEEVMCGDLAFFDNESGKIVHVGILLDQKTIIHASGRVRRDTIDNFGIVNIDTGKRTHSLRVIKRMFN